MSRLKSFTVVENACIVMIIGLMFFSVGAFMLGTFGTGPWKRWRSASWERVPVRLLSADEDTACYRFAYGGRKHYGTRIHFGISTASSDSRTEYAARLRRIIERQGDELRAEPAARYQPEAPPGTPELHQGFVNPADPEDCVLFREMTGITWMLLPFGLAFAAAGGWTFKVGAVRLRNRLRGIAPDPDEVDWTPLPTRTAIGAAILGAAFVAAGLYFAGQGTRQYARVLGTASWQRVPVQLQSVALEEKPDSDHQNTYALRAEYRYSFGGRTYSGRRVFLGDTGMANSALYRLHYEMLRDHQRSNELFEAWLNPQRPEESVLFREAAPRAWYHIPFGFVFVFFGALALRAGSRSLAERFRRPVA